MSYTNTNPRMAVAAVAGLATEQIYLSTIEGGFAIALPPDAPQAWGGEIWDYYRSLYPSLADDPPNEEAVASWEEPAPPPPAPVTDVDIAKQYQQAYQVAEGIIFLLMGRVAPTLIQKKYFTEDTVNAEGTKFTKYHREVIQDFKNSGRHPDAGDEMYAAFVGSKETFPWVEDKTILTIFASTIPRNPT